jgi:uncharacterized membrane protein
MPTWMQHTLAWAVVIGLVVIAILTVLDGMARLSRRQKTREWMANENEIEFVEAMSRVPGEGTE